MIEGKLRLKTEAVNFFLSESLINKLVENQYYKSKIVARRIKN